MLGFDRFSERAQEAATRAYEIMLRYKHTQLDTEHVLLALLEQPDGVVTSLLEGIANVDHIRHRLDDVLKAGRGLSGTGPLQPQQVYITPRVKALMERSSEEASKRGDDLISTEHMFLAILAE